MPKMRRRWIVLIVIAVLLTAVGGRIVQVFFLPAGWGGRFTISRETTFLTEPLNEDGTINYVAAQNEYYGRGVTPQNNAAVLLLQAVGPQMLVEETRRRTLAQLGIASLPEGGDYFVGLREYLQANLSEDELKRPPKPTTDASEDTIRKALPKLPGFPFFTPPSPAEQQVYYNQENAGKAPWSSEDYPHLAGWLKANEKPLALAVAATARPRFFIPMVSPSDPPSILETSPNWGAARGMTRALVARAMLKADSGDVERAFADLMAVHRLARLASQTPELIDRFAAISLERTAAQGDCALAASETLALEHAQAFLVELNALAPLPDVVETLDRCDRFMLMDAAMALRRAVKKKRPDYPQNMPRTVKGDAFDWDSILRTANYWCDRRTEVMRKETYAERTKAYQQLDRDFTPFWQALFERTKYTGRFRVYAKVFLLGRDEITRQGTEVLTGWLMSSFLPSLARCQIIHDNATAGLELAKVSMALAAYKAEKGEYPPELSDLVPKYLRAIPNDLFTGRPIVYRREGKGYIMYSVGENTIDDGGKDRSEDVDDIVVRVPVVLREAQEAENQNNSR